jgi:ATP/maltotriose-dependent transcriptional regulator MalT
VLHGAWEDAMDEAERARELLSDPPDQPAVGLAFYQQGELHRLRGELAQAEEAYRQAGRWTRRPRPGLAQLRLSQGQLESAQATIRRQLEETADQRARPQLLAAAAEIMLAAGDTVAARNAADELLSIADAIDAPFLHALSERTAGAVLLAEGDAQASQASLRDAWVSWQQLDAPYDAARTRVLIGLACRALGDEDAAQMELDAANHVFRELGAAPDIMRVEELSRQPAPQGAGPLTKREVQVLRLVATGKTNRAIAAELFISEKTGARHLSNLFLKLGLESRAAATAWAYKHEIV